VEKGAAMNRRLVMHNDFVFVGPNTDKAKIKGAKTLDALNQLPRLQPFLFRAAMTRELTKWKSIFGKLQVSNQVPPGIRKREREWGKH